jgi:hypothetical protein
MREPRIERAGRGEAGAEPAVSALNDEQPGGLTGRAGLPPEIGVQARYERLAVTHATTLGQLPTLSIGFIDNAPRAADEFGYQANYQANAAPKFMPYIGGCTVIRLRWPVPPIDGGVGPFTPRAATSYGGKGPLTP